MKKTFLIFIPISLLFTDCKYINPNPTKTKVEQNDTSQTGEKIEKYPNGNIKIKGDLVKGIRQGLWTSFYENGLKWSESEYLFGKRNGVYKSFYSNGRLRIHGAYKEDVKKGIWYFYNENGKFEKEIDFDLTPSTQNDSI